MPASRTRMGESSGAGAVQLPQVGAWRKSFRLTTQKWAQLAKIDVGWEEWSHNGDYVYFLGNPEGGRSAGVFRVRISDHKLEQVLVSNNIKRFSVLANATM